MIDSMKTESASVVETPNGKQVSLKRIVKKAREKGHHKVTESSLANLKPFNASAREKSKQKRELEKELKKDENSIINWMRRLLDQPCPHEKNKTWGEALAIAALDMAVEKPEALRIVLDRLYGKPAVEISGPGGGPIETVALELGKDDIALALQALHEAGALTLNAN